MNHIRFTVQFFILLLAIPLLMFIEITRDGKSTNENPGGSEKSAHIDGTAYSMKPAGPILRRYSDKVFNL